MPSALYWVALGLTLVLEGGLILLLARRERRAALRDCAVLNLLTHPLAWLAVTSRTVGLWPAEAVVLLVEIAGYRALGPRRSWRSALIWATVVNLATTLVGITPFPEWIVREVLHL